MDASTRSNKKNLSASNKWNKVSPTLAANVAQTRHGTRAVVTSSGGHVSSRREASSGPVISFCLFLHISVHPLLTE